MNALRRLRASETAVLAVTISLLLHAFAYVAALNVCESAAGCGVPPAIRRANDEVVESVSRIAISQRARRGEGAAHAGRSSLALRGPHRPLRRGQGEYWPVRAWRSHGTRFYSVAYRFVYRDGRLEQGEVPWPVHFAPGDDPFAAAGRGERRATALPPPPSDYMPPGTLGRALRAYFPQLSFED